MEWRRFVTYLSNDPRIRVRLYAPKVYKQRLVVYYADGRYVKTETNLGLIFVTGKLPCHQLPWRE